MLNTVNVNSALPWELNPALRQERLEALAHVAVATRNRAFAEADREAGDTNWGLACKAHERLMHQLTQLVARGAHGAHSWLGVVRDGLYLMPLIDGVPIRIFRGASDRVASRHLDAVRLEHERWQAAAPQMAFDFMAGSSADGGGPWYWLMAMETDAAGMVVRVVYFQANDAGETRNAWPCPLAPSEASAPQPSANTAASEKALSPVVRLADKRAKRDQRDQRDPRGRRGAKQAPTEAARQDSRQEGFWGALGAE
jgi:hypothetical protein